MKTTALLSAGAACLLIASCTGHKATDTSTHSDVAATSDSVQSYAATTGNLPQNMIGTYTDLNDGSTLEISSSASVKISLFRLTEINDSIGKVSDGVLTFTATDAAGQPIAGKITFAGDTAHLTFTESTWEYLPQGTTYSFIRGAKTDYETANPIGGRTYTGSGKGGGLATNVTIKFDKTKTCQCTSDFYQAFANPVTVNGTYSINYDIVQVKCLPDGLESPIVWNFEIIDDGESLSFNISNPSEEGSIGTDWLRLKVK